MFKKLTVFFAVLAFASFSSVAMACDTSCKGDKKGDGSDTELSGLELFDAAGSGCGQNKCGKKKDGDSA